MQNLHSSQKTTIAVYSFVVRSAKISVSLYAALSREAEIIVAELTDDVAVNVDALYKQKLDVLQTCLFPD